MSKKENREFFAVDYRIIADLIGDRLFYHTRALVLETNKVIEIAGIRSSDEWKNNGKTVAIVTDTHGNEYNIEEIRPYLRPLESLNENERKSLFSHLRYCIGGQIKTIEDFYKLVHIDNWQYIEKGYALEYNETIGGYDTSNLIL